MAVHNLPQHAAPFVGRSVEITEISNRLNDDACRLLTLAGPGGIGKTRLALELAHLGAARFEDGVYFVPLQPLQDIDHIVTTIVDALPLQLMDNDDPRQRLLDYLSKKRLLLVLDNFEHLLSGVDIVIDILNATTQVQLLVTSRERLNLRAEQVWPMTGLDIPVGTDNAPIAYSAVQLFTERARRVQPHFSLESQQANVIRICRLVDGLPLALELAAAWTRVMPCNIIAREIETNIDILSASQRDIPERHQSIRAVFDHSWHLMSQTEQVVFCRLAVFRGGFTAEAAEKITGTSLQTLAVLIDKSLIRMDDSGRYHLHELLRQYAEAQLESADETQETLERHSEYFAQFMNERDAVLKGFQQLEALDEIEADFDNVRAAWRWSVETRNHALVNAAMESLSLYCTLRSRFHDHQMMFKQARAAFAPQATDEPTITWARITIRSYPFAGEHSVKYQPEEISAVRLALRIIQSLADKTEIARCIYQLALLTIPENEVLALELVEESLQYFVAAGEEFYRGRCLLTRAAAYAHLGQIEYNFILLQEAVEFCRAHDSRSPARGASHSMLGMTIAFGHGNYVDGEGLVREAVDFFRSINSPGETARIIRWLSSIVFVQGNFEEARQLAEECRMVAYHLDYFEYLGGGSAILGMVYNMQQDYRRGKELGQESLRHSAKPPRPDGVLSAWALSCSFCGLGDPQEASNFLHLALENAHNMVFQRGFTALCAPVAAYIHARNGHFERSVELLALAFTHPYSPTGWLKKWSLINELCADLKNQLGEQAFANAWERGTALELELLTLQLMGELSEVSNVIPTQANQTLIDPLSPRELEVLALVAEGLTNSEIADHLVVGVSTVKKHINHIYDKLDVRNRTSAVARANDLKLLH